MTQEQKAQRYDEAIDIARKINSGEGVAAPSGWTTCEVIFPELKESEDERIRKELIEFVKSRLAGFPQCEKFIAWLEGQGEHANFRNKIQVGDKVTRNEDGVLVNLSQLKRIAKKDEKQGEQKPNPCDGCINHKGCINCENEELRETEQKTAGKVEPKFHEGEWITIKE